MAYQQILQSPKNPHFFQPLLPGFHSHLSIPLDFFFKHVEGRNKKNMVELTSDACKNTWRVKLEGRKLTLGWKEFTEAHNFRVGDVIIFKHEGDFLFHVTGLGPSCCEIQYVQSSDKECVVEEENIRTKQNLKTEPDGDNKDNMAMLRRKEKWINEVEAESFVAHITESNLRVDTLDFPKRFVWSDYLKKGINKIVLMDEGAKKTWTLNLMFRKSKGIFYMRHGWRNFCHENMLKPGDFVTFKRERNNTKTPLLRMSTSESKCVFEKDSTEEKRRKTGESSQSKVSSTPSGENRFLTLTVTPSSLKDCRVYLPLSFTRLHKMEKVGGKEITMLDQHGVEWPVYLSMEKRCSRLRFRLAVKAFFKAVGIKTNESVVLELIWEDKTNPPVFKFCSRSRPDWLICICILKLLTSMACFSKLIACMH